MAILVEVTFFDEDSGEASDKKMVRLVSNERSSYEADRALRKFIDAVLEKEYPGHNSYD